MNIGVVVYNYYKVNSHMCDVDFCPWTLYKANTLHKNKHRSNKRPYSAQANTKSSLTEVFGQELEVPSKPCHFLLK